jgi:hypothetical protein
VSVSNTDVRVAASVSDLTGLSKGKIGAGSNVSDCEQSTAGTLVVGDGDVPSHVAAPIGVTMACAEPYAHVVHLVVRSLLSA